MKVLKNDVKDLKVGQLQLRADVAGLKTGQDEMRGALRLILDHLGLEPSLGP